MIKTYPLTQCIQLLGVDSKTLSKWVKKAGIDLEKQVSKKDGRIRYLTEEQLRQLADDHDRDLNQAIASMDANQRSGQGGVNLGVYKHLEERVDRLEARDSIDPDQIDDWMKDYAHRIIELESKYAHVLDQLADALVALKEIQEWKAMQENNRTTESQTQANYSEAGQTLKKETSQKFAL